MDKILNSKPLKYISLIAAVVLIGYYLNLYIQTIFVLDYMPHRSDPITYFLDYKAYWETGKFYSPFIMDENISKAFIEVGLHGPMYEFFYGTICQIFGYHDKMILIVNLFVFIAVITLTYMNKGLNLLSKNLLVIFNLTYFIHLWSSFNFTPEYLHVFFAHMIGFALIKIKSENRSKNVLYMAMWILIAATFRYSWVLASFSLLAFVENKKDFYKTILIVSAITFFGFAYLKLLHADYFHQVIGPMVIEFKQGDIGAGLQIVLDNLSATIPMFFFTYFYSLGYFATKWYIIIAVIILGYLGYKTNNRIAIASALICLAYLLSLFLFFDAYDTRDLRGIGGSMIIATIVLLSQSQSWSKIPVIAVCIIYLLVMPETIKGFEYFTYDECKASGQIINNYNFNAFAQLKARSPEMITILFPEKMIWVATPGRPVQSIKDILHTPALKFPLKNFEGVPLRYTFNHEGLDTYLRHNKIRIDYLVTPNGQIVPA
ncbi:MAG: hypothetical protein LW817_01005 [Candidatus Caenarcaniphilales bacterium]|jgi:hypothetical protein|nr:hypothetical protein [Candidatus Caenarcaniphilales bacterium]